MRRKSHQHQRKLMSWRFFIIHWYIVDIHIDRLSVWCLCIVFMASSPFLWYLWHRTAVITIFSLKIENDLFAHLFNRNVSNEDWSAFRSWQSYPPSIHNTPSLSICVILIINWGNFGSFNRHQLFIFLSKFCLFQRFVQNKMSARLLIIMGMKMDAKKIWS